MVEVRLSTLLLILLALPVQAAEDGVRTVTYNGLAARSEVVVEQGQPTLQLRHPDAVGDPDTTRHAMLLFRRIDLERGQSLSATVNVHRWIPVIDQEVIPGFPDTATATVTTEVLGTFDHAPRVAVLFRPWAVDGRVIYVADSATITLTVNNKPVAPEPIIISEDRAWYDPSQPHVRVITARDGVAQINLTDVVATDPRFESADPNELALFYRGQEQPIHIDDVRSTITFQGRHAFGDTLWMDMDDSVAVYFLTTRQGGERLRYTIVDGVSGDPLRSLRLHERVEFDTGYYHLGNAVSVDFSDYNSDLVYLEGFYWESLNGTAGEHATFRYRATPRGNGNARFTAHYVSSADAPAYDPDTRTDLVLNGATRSTKITEGWARYDLSVEVPNAELPSGMQSLRLFSTGIDSVRNEPGYFSNILLDWYEIEMDVYPLLDSGRLNALTSIGNEATVEVWNGSSDRGVVIDTLNDQISFLTAVGTGTVIRSGMSPTDPVKADRPWDGNSFRISAILGDHAEELVVEQDLVLFLQGNDDVVRVYQVSDDVDALTNALNAATDGTSIALINTGVATPQSVQAALAAHGQGAPDESYWLLSYLVGGNRGSAKSKDALAAPLGLFHREESSLSGRTILQAPLGPFDDAALFIADANGIESARIEPAHLTDLLVDVPQADLVIIAHDVHREQAERLAEHRRTLNGLAVSLYDIDAVLDEFGTGHRSPDAVRAFLAALYADAPVPKPHTVILFGNASWDPRLAIRGGNSGSRRADQVPTYGRPSSDYFFGLLDDPNDRAVPEVVVGRIPALTAEEGRHQIDKIIHMDTVTFQSWMRRWLFVGGGVEQEGLCDHYMNLLGDPFNSGITFHDAPMCMDTATVCKYDGRANPGYDIKLNIDQGLQWMNYFGHGATDQFDIRGWEPSELVNAGRYGVLATYACQTGAFSNTSVQAKNVEYVTAEGVGFAAAVGGTGWEYVATISQLQFRIHEILRGSSIRELGELIYESKLPFAGSGQIGINTVMQYSILGDPLMRVRMDTVPEIYLREEQVTVSSSTGRPELTDEDPFANIDVTIGSAGLGVTDPFEAWVIRSYDGTMDTTRLTLHDGICLDAPVRFQIPIENRAGEHRLTIIGDAFRTLGDDTTDNTVSLTFIVLPRSLLPIEPLPHGSIHDTEIAIRVLDPLSTPNKTMEITFEVVQVGTVVLRSAEEQITRSGSVVDWMVDLGSAPLQLGPASLIVRARDPVSQVEAAPLALPITIRNDLTPQREDVEIPAERFINQSPETITLDTVSGRYHLRTFERDAFVLSRGIPPADFETPALQMRLGDVMYVDNRFFRGINVIVFNQFDTIPRAIRRYDTWRDPIPAEQGHDGYSNECIAFLRDSVGPGDRVLLASCNESFTGFEKDKNFDEFRAVISSLGSRFADSLGPQSSWAMIGAYGLNPGEATEAWKGRPDTLAISEQPLTFSATSGMVFTPWIGPALTVDSLAVDLVGDGITSQVWGRTPDGQVLAVGTLDNGVWRPGADQDWGTTVYQIRHELQHQESGPSSIGGAVGSYIEADEWLIEFGDVSIDTNEVVRADTVSVRIRVRHARADRAAQPVDLRVFIPDGTGQAVESIQRGLGPFFPDERRDVFMPIATTRAPQSADVIVSLNPMFAASELYAFNNGGATVLTVREDDEPPTIQIVADGADVTSGGYVAPDAFLEVRLHDRSNLPVNDPSRLTVFVNGDRIRESVAEDLEFLPTDSVRVRYPELPDIRAALVFRYPLEPGQNNVLVRGSDATGNQVEHECALFVTDGLAVTAVAVSPNPSTGPVTFRIDVQTSVRDLTGILHIYDAEGRRIRDLKSPLQLGQAVLEWDGRGSAGEVVPSGMYVYRLEVSEPSIQGASGMNGTLMILR